jgi:hypothetical protein
MIGDATGLTIPAVFATFATGADLASIPGATVRVKVEFTAETRPSYNVFAESASGDDSNVVMAGAHLESVQDGAGINDNGSGSAAVLEVALKLAEENVMTANKVRFAWWGAEESGLLGSEHYVDSLTPAEREDIALYLNFDMIASPNYMFGVYDGDNSGGTAAPGFIPPGSAEIEDVFEALLHQPWTRVQRHRVLRPVRLRAVHCGRHPCRWPVHRSRGCEDCCAGRGLRRRCRCGVRPVLPPVLRQPAW